MRRIETDERQHRSGFWLLMHNTQQHFFYRNENSLTSTTIRMKPIENDMEYHQRLFQ